MEKIWNVKERKYKNILDQLLYNRGIFFDEDPDLKDRFLSPDFSRDLNDPFLMIGMKKAVDRIVRAKENGEKIGIFSDYDADGIPAAALLHRAFKALGIRTTTYIPNREGGYGLSASGIDFLISEKCDLILTADLGIKSFVEAEYCISKNIDLIITDHHLPDVDLPKGFAVINVKQPQDPYPYKELCGCGVAYKLVQALAQVFPEDLPEKFLKWNLDLVAISTIADVVPLNGENRVLAKYGLMVLQKSKNVGLKALFEAIALKETEIDAWKTGFQIAPRINAPGRIDHATKSYELLTTEDKDEAKDLARWLDQKNYDRQKEMERTSVEAIAQIEDEKLSNNNILVVAGDWLKGVIGPTASRLVEKYNRPVVLFSKADDVYSGSARSIEGVNIVELFSLSKDLIERFGGHKGAAGISVKKENFSSFVKSLIKSADKFIDKEVFTSKVDVDLEAQPEEIDLDLTDQINMLEPYGLGNPKPVFKMSDVILNNCRYVGGDKNHLSCMVEKNGLKFKTIYFNATKNSLMNGDFDHIKYDIIFQVNIDTWGDTKKVQLNIVDIKKNG